MLAPGDFADRHLALSLILNISVHKNVKDIHKVLITFVKL